MAKRKVAETVENSDNLIADLVSGSMFKFIGENGEVGKGSLSDKPKVETPLIALNCLLGGGLPLGSIIEVFGPNASGKSSFMYETLGNFQRKYSNGVTFIIDSETSTDDSRLRQLGVDPVRAPRMGAATLEDGFEQISLILKKMINNEKYNGFPVFILWDTIAAAPTRAQLKEGNMYAGGMAERARILKTSLMTIFPLIEKQNVLLVLLNQVMSEIGGWRPGLTSGGGNALKHDIHIRLELQGGKTIYEGPYPVSKYSTLNISKSKVSPIMNDFPIIIDITKGGVIDREGSFAWWIANLSEPGVFNQAAWWSVQDWCYEKYKVFWDKIGRFYPKFRQSVIYEVVREDSRFVDLLQLIWLDLISKRYVLQSEVVKELREEVLTRLMVSLGVSSEDLCDEKKDSEEVTTDVSVEDLNALSSALSDVSSSLADEEQ